MDHAAVATQGENLALHLAVALQLTWYCFNYSVYILCLLLLQVYKRLQLFIYFYFRIS